MLVRQGVLDSQRWRRLIPIAFITYSFAYLDRPNYSFGAAGGLTGSITPLAAPVPTATSANASRWIRPFRLI
jgi:hypothetical protein